MERYRSQNKGLCSIEIKPDGVAFACVARPGSREITACNFFRYPNSNKLDNQQIRECIGQIVSLNSLRRTLCTWVLHRDFYHITLIDTPNVPQAEYKNAVRWQVKDIINYPLEDVAVDLFDPDEQEKTLKKLYVIVSQRSFLQGIIDIFQEVELYPVAIDIVEFAARNLLMDIAQPDETVGLLDVTENSCLLIIVRQNNVKFVRRIPVGYKKTVEGNCDALVKELKRSFDYCRTELNQQQPSRLLLSPQTGLDRFVTESIEKCLNNEVKILDLKKVVTFKTPIEKNIEAKCWVAIGGVLRDPNNQKT